MAGERIVPPLCGSQKELAGVDRRESEVFYLSGSSDPITPSLHIVVLVVVGFWLYCSCLFVFGCYLKMCFPSICLSFQLVSISLSDCPPSLSVTLSGRLAVSPSMLFTQSAYCSLQSSVTPATARRAWKGVCLIDHIGITH